MLTMRIYPTVILCVFCFFSTSLGQSQAQTATPSGVTITAAATGERVRLTAPSSVVQMHVEVYALSGEKLFDQEIRGGNVFDWHLQDGQAQRLAPGTYVCVVTAKSVSGKLSQKLGHVTVGETSASVQPADSQQLSTPQAQAIGPVEENSSWIIAGEDTPQTTAVIASDGHDGHMIRGRGALTFRIGNFFSGLDQEQMRLTETGDLGIGTSAPKAKLDVAGTIRAERFLIARPKLSSVDKTEGTQSADATNAVQPLVGGSGTTNQLTKWADGAAGMVEDSMITESGGRIGIGTTAPVSKLQVRGGDISLDADQSIRKDGDNAIITYRSSLPGIVVGSGTQTDQVVLYGGGHERMRIDPSGNVGVGTNSPTTRLQVAGGDISIDPDQSIRRAGDPGNAIITYRSSLPGIVVGSGTETDQVALYAGGYERMRIAANGNLGIGTKSPRSPLTVNGTIEITSGGIKFPNGTIQTTAGGGSSNYLLKTGGTMTGTLTLPTNGLKAGSNQLVLSGGNVGIGTTNVTSRLTVAGTIESTSGGIKFPDGTVQTTAGGGGSGGSGNYVSKAGDTMTGTLNLPANGLVIGRGFQKGTVQLAIVNGGIGIGTDTPGATLAVNGNLYASNTNGIAVSGSSALGQGVYAWSDSGYALFARTNTGVAARVNSDSGNLLEGWSVSSGIRRFFFAYDGTLNLPANGLIAGANQLVLSGGGVGIGTATPKTPLQVESGDVYVSAQGNGIILRATDGANCFRVTVNKTGLLTADAITCP